MTRTRTIVWTAAIGLFAAAFPACGDSGSLFGTGGAASSSTTTTSSTGQGGSSSSTSASTTTTSTSTASGTGGAGGGAPCMQPSDCGDNECKDYSCVSGHCQEAFKPEGAPVKAQTAGDCRLRQCDGAGVVEEVADQGDLPNDNNDCTADVCQSGSASNPPLDSGVPCGANKALFCNGAGLCVGCVDAGDCGGQDTECQTRSCAMGVCSFVFAAQGTLVAAQKSGDCKVDQCDGAGGVQAADDNSDVPVDGLQCTSDLCVSGAPSNPPLAVGKPCSQNGGSMCDGNGACAACLGPADCPGVDDECQARTCVKGACGVAFTLSGTPVSSQTSGDCKKNVCDGAGAVLALNDPADLPVDQNTCTSDVCNGGVPSNPPVANGQGCGNGLACLNGSCSGCAKPSDCPGMDDECKTRTCSAGTCGFAFTAAGTPVAAQSSGDCKKNVCDGAGATQAVADNSDLPVDNNACTSDLCTNGSPTNPLLPTNTACSGGFCSPQGQCVACNTASQCPGMDTDCKSRSCVAGTCGVVFAPAGTVTTTQTTGECQVKQCDGSGGVVQVSASSDVPADDGNQCTGEICSNGQPQHPARALNFGCSQNNGAYCDGAGACVACNQGSQCPGTDTDCQARSCASHQCGFTFTAAGTPTSSQTLGDCKENRCDGAGGVSAANNDLDVPADDGIQCTGEACSGGVPSHPPKAVDFGCNQVGGQYCDGAGTCVQCNSGGECPSGVCTAHVCAAPTCNDGVQNGAETDVDCGGGTCPACGPNKGCMLDADCSGGACNMATKTCAPTCVSDPSALGATCASYCSCMTATCAATFADNAACIAACESFAEPQLCCRAYHCGAAMSDPVTHCPHASGVAVCP